MINGGQREFNKDCNQMQGAAKSCNFASRLTATIFVGSCNESSRTYACRVEDPFVIAHYAHLEEGMYICVRLSSDGWMECSQSIIRGAANHWS
jgi:hypothetical protein